MKITGQSVKHDASDLTFLYDFVSQCPDPHIATSLQKLVQRWLSKPNEIPHLPTAIKQILRLSNEDVIQICWLLAINPRTPPSVLQDLCSKATPGMLERIAENQNAWPSTLAELSFQALAEIRIATAGNPNTPLASIMVLVRDENPDVRFSMAENTHIPLDALNALAKDDNPYIKFQAEQTLRRVDIESRLDQAVIGSGMPATDIPA